MAGSFGIGLGSFLKGVADGANAYSGIQTAKSQQKLNDMRVKEAESDLAEKTRLQDLEADQNRRKQVGLKQAELAHPDNIMKQMEYYNTNTIPALQKEYIKAGQDQAAQVLGKFVETEQGKTLTRLSAASINSAFMGDKTGLKTSMQETINTASNILGTPKYEIGDITDAVGADGKPTGGMVIPIKDANGNVQNMTFNSSADLVKFINNTSMPHAIVEYAYDQEQQARKIRAETASNNQKWKQKIAEKGLDFKYDIERDKNSSSLRREEARNSSGLRIQEQTNQAQLDNAYGGGSGGSKKVAEAEATIQLLRENGVPEEYIQANITSIAGLENKQRPMSSRIDDYIKMRSGADLRFGQLSAAQQVAEAKKYIAAVDEQSGGSDGTADNPFPANNSQGKGLTPYYDSRTNQVVYR